MSHAAELIEVASLIRSAARRLGRLHLQLPPALAARVEDATAYIDPIVADVLEGIAQEIAA